MDHPPSTSSTNDRRVSSVSWTTALMICLAVLMAISMPGCGGCFNQDPLAQREENKKKKKKKEKPKPDFEIGSVRTVPRDDTSVRNLVKAGHWMSATQPMKANNYDFKADIESASTNIGGTPFEIPNTLYRMTMSRPAGLPKGQVMQFETTYFIPNRPTRDDGVMESRAIWLKNSLRARRGGRELKKVTDPTVLMPDYQYFFVVLSDEPDRYGHLKRMESVSPPVVGDGSMMDEIRHYRVLLPKIENRVPLPSQPLMWTTIAYVLWDGMNPDSLSLEQQQSVVDWLHWGGQIIISGPDSLDALRGSFLAPYLPARGGEAVSLPSSAFSELDAGWSIKNARTKTTASLKIAADKPPVGVQLEPHADAVPLWSTGGLVYERRVGTGRIVVSSFSLTDRQIVNWGSFDSFFNACLLRRPRRQFRWVLEAGQAVVEWADQPGYTNQLDGRYVTGLRYFARDTGSAATSPPTWQADSSQEQVAGWNERSAAADISRRSLGDAAGITIPKAGFVFRVLVVYLLVLAPLNWGIFRLCRRVEWAWIAAPMIAVAGAVVVVRLAQLDIGFARSRTEIGILELHDGYRRGHLTRYTALYASLSTPYDLQFDDDSALATPFPHLNDAYERGHQSIKTVQFRRDQKITLSGFQVVSNSSGYVHSEQMQDVGGALQLLGDDTAGWMVQNTTDLNLQDVGVLRKLPGGRVELAWVGALESAKSSPLSFELAAAVEAYCPQWTESPTCYSYERQQRDILARADGDGDEALSPEEVSGLPELESRFLDLDVDPRDGKLSKAEVLKWCVQSRGGQLTLGRLVDLASQRSALREGDVRLIGWVDQDLPGLTIYPQASQEAVRILVLAHLKRGGLPDAQRDANLKAEVNRLPEPSELDEFEGGVRYGP
jgi:hypothetical protein